MKCTLGSTLRRTEHRSLLAVPEGCGRENGVLKRTEETMCGVSTEQHGDLSTTPARPQICLCGRMGLNTTGILVRLSHSD